ncbi:MAG: SRPBCC family protein [Pseudomonadota bacterium]
MKFSSREDIEAPQERVFELLCDFKAAERSATRRGVDVRRTDTLSDAAAVGMSWDAAFWMRGRKRKLDLQLAELDHPNAMTFNASSSNIFGVFSIELVPLSRKRTRMAVALEVSPKTLSARLLIQSLRVAKSSLTKRYKLRIAEYARQLEKSLLEAT